MSLPELVEETIESVLEAYAYSPDNIDFMVENICALFPDMHPDIIRKHISGKVCYDEMDELGTYEQDEPISETEMANALQMGDKQSSIDYLKILYPNFSREILEGQYEAAVKQSKKKKRKSSARKRHSMDFEVTDMVSPRKSKSKRRSKREFEVADVDAPRKSKTRWTSRIKEDPITHDDIQDAWESCGFSSDPGVKEKIVDQLMRKYPKLGICAAYTSLVGYDFGDKASTPDEPAVSYTLTTPPRRGGAYDPIDFSPSTYGAAGSVATHFLESRRATHLPHYTSPARTPLPSPRSPTPRRRFRDELPTPPRTPRRSTRSPTGRRLTFFDRSPDRYDE